MPGRLASHMLRKGALLVLALSVGLTWFLGTHTQEPSHSAEKEKARQEQKKAQQKQLPGTFACAINCMDGRTQDAVQEYMMRHYRVDYVDMVTEAGPNKFLGDTKDQFIIDNIRKRVEVSVVIHKAKVVAIVGHEGCAGNPNPREVQLEHLRQAKRTVEGYGFNVEVVILWVRGDWRTVDRIE
jgi:hypothetical protein